MAEESENHRSQEGIKCDDSGNGVDLGVQNVPQWGPGIADSNINWQSVWHGRGIGEHMNQNASSYNLLVFSVRSVERIRQQLSGPGAPEECGEEVATLLLFSIWYIGGLSRWRIEELVWLGVQVLGI